MMQQISVTRALTTLKVLKEQITQYFQTARPMIVALQGSEEKPVGHGADKATVEKLMKSNYDTYASLLKRYDAIKSKLLISNAHTQVSIGGKTMSVTEAIELKATLPFKIALLTSMKSQYGATSQHVIKINAEMETAIQKNIANLKTTEPEDSKSRQDYITSFVQLNKDRSEAKLHDLLGLDKKIVELENEVTVIKTELDYVLSESNTKTLIEIDLE